MSVVANVAINVDSRGATQKLREVQVGARATEQAFNALTSAAAAFGAGFAISKVIQDVKELDTNLRRLGTVGGDVTALDKGLGQLSKNLGGVASKAELAAASYQALSAGFTETGVNLRLVEAATKAAVGGLADTTQVTEVLTKTLNAYGLSGNQAIKVTDSISKAIEYGQVEWSDYTSQLGRVASVAAVAGVSLDEVNAFVAAATKNGATAEVAFTGLGSTLATILKPSKESADAAAALGINWTLAGIQGEGFESLMGKLAVAMQKNPELATQMVGGQEAVRGAFAAAAKGGKDYQAALESIGGAAGKTDKDFQAMKASLVNQLKALDTAFKNLSEALGRVFGPELVKSVTDVTGAINGLADAISAIPAPIAKLIGETVKVIAIYVALQKAIQAVIALRAGYIAAMTSMAATTAATGTAATASSSAFALYTANTRTLQAAAAGATPALAGLRGILASLASIGTIAIAVNIAVYGIQAVLQARAELDRLRGVRQAGGAAGVFGGSAPAASKEAARKTLAAIEEERKKNLPMQAIGQISGFGRGLGNTRERILAERQRFARGVLALPTRAPGAGGLPTPTPIPQTPFGGEDEASKKKKGKTDAERLAEQIAKQKAAAAEALAVEKGRLQVAQTAEPLQRQITEAIVRQNDIKREYANKLNEAKSAEETLNLQMAERNALQTNALELQKALSQEVDQLTQPLADLVKGSAERLAFENKYQQLLAQGINPELAKEYAQLELAAEKQSELLTLRLAELEGAKAKLKAESDVAKALQEQIDKIKEILKLQKGQVDRSKQETEEEKKKREEREKKEEKEKQRAAELKALYGGIASTIENGIVNAIDAGISSLLDGTKSLSDALKEIASGVLKEIGMMFVKFAIRQAFSAFGFAEGGYVPGGFKAFADGGLVTSPTMGMVGEGGEAEYIIPASKMSSAMARYSAGARGESVLSGNAPAQRAPQALDINYNVTDINGMRFVTEEQFTRGMRDAAKMGQAMTFNTLRSAPSVRRKLGV